MKRAQRTIYVAAEPSRRQAVIYARVSSKEQEKEGFSIPAQLKLLKDYASTNGFAIAHEYVDVETAKQAGRAAFGEMVAYLSAHPSVRVMLAEKTDRLYRNLKDWVTVDELEVEIHFPKEGVVLSRDARSSEKFMHGIKVLMAKNYIDNLSEETRKGMTEKAEQGLWPSNAPLGYRNVTGTEGRKTIVPDESIAPIIRNLFEWYARGDISIREATKKARAAGLVFRKSRGRIPGEHSCKDPAQQNLYRSIRLGRQGISGALRADHFRRSLGAGSGCFGRADRSQVTNAKTGLCILGAD
jgi:site-specific DNA recombinase